MFVFGLLNYCVGLSTTTESELKQSDNIELVTDQPEVDETIDPEKQNENIDYDSTEDIALSSTAKSSTNSYPRLDSDNNEDLVECSSDRSVKISSKQYCDGIKNCPNGEDENPEQCRPGEFCV